MAGIFGDNITPAQKKKLKRKKKSNDTSVGSGMAEGARKKLKGRAAKLKAMEEAAGI